MTLEEFIPKALMVPFQDHGRSYEGWDCWGLVYVAYRDIMGVTLPSYSGEYDRAGDTRESRNQLDGLIRSHLGPWSVVEERLPLDVVLFRIGGQPVHVGLLVDRRRMLHAEARIGTQMERMSSSMWNQRLEGVYRYGG